jgi:acyl carrier protein
MPAERHARALALTRIGRTMTKDDVYAFLAATFRDVFKRDVAITPELSAADVKGWDSFAQIAIIVASEEHFGIEFTSKELDSLKNVGDFAGVVLAKTKSGS